MGFCLTYSVTSINLQTKKKGGEIRAYSTGLILLHLFYIKGMKQNRMNLCLLYRYILFDGDVDALWVENMNSVMDDNRLLTLANGERIRLQNHCAMLFEVSCNPFILSKDWNSV